MKTRITCLLLAALMILSLPSWGAPAAGASQADEESWYWPLGPSSSYADITSVYGYRTNFGRNHDGLDIGKPIGTPVYASKSGTLAIHCSKCTGNTYGGVITCTTEGCQHGNGLGNYLSINHGNGETSFYGHLSTIVAKTGDEVSQGDLIAYVGNTGNSTGPHLHFALKRDGEWVNPNPADYTITMSSTATPGENVYVFKVGETVPLPAVETLSVCPNGKYPLPSGTLTKGKSRSVRGTVVSTHGLKQVTAGIYGTDGSTYSEYKYTSLGGAKQVDLQKADNTLKFGVLPAGDFALRIDVVGQTKSESFSYPFTIKDENPPATYTITFQANGGSVSKTTKTVTAGGTYGNLPIPTRNGYDFTGWYTEKEGGDQVTEETTAPKENRTLYAQWIERNKLNNFKEVNTYKNGLFSDVSKSDWYHESVKKAYCLGLMQGTGDGTFSVDGEVTVAEAVAIASRICSIFYGEELPREESPWYQSYVTYAKENGILTHGYDNYERACTRAEFAEILAHALPDEALEEINSVSKNAIPDVSSGYIYADEIYTLYRAGVLTGKENDLTFQPKENILRGEAASVVAKLVDTSLRVTF